MKISGLKIYGSQVVLSINCSKACPAEGGSVGPRFFCIFRKKIMKYNTLWLIALLMFAVHGGFAQSDSVQQQIDAQVWKPFIQSFNSQDNETFASVHSKEVARVIQDDNRILNYDQYFQKVPDSIKAKWGNWKRNIQLRFIKRIAGNDKAFDIGYYKTVSTNATTGETRTSYGKFHVLLRKENGVWKILMDTDAKENIDEAIFLTGTPPHP